MPAVSVPGYSTVREVADRLEITSSRVRQILKELREERPGEEIGYLVGTTRLLSPTDVAMIERRYSEKRPYRKPEAV